MRIYCVEMFHPTNYLILFVFKAKKPMNYVDCNSFTLSVPKISMLSNAHHLWTHIFAHFIQVLN